MLRTIKMELATIFLNFMLVVSTALVPSLASSQNYHYKIESFVSSDGFKNPLDYAGDEEKGEMEKGILESPGYPTIYPPSINASWLLGAPPRHTLKLIIKNLELEQSKECKNDYLDVYDGDNIWNPQVVRLCGKQGGLWFRSTGVDLFLVFVADHQYELSGFQLEYVIEKTGKNCNETAREFEGVIFSPRYSDSTECWTLIEIPNKENQVVVTFFHTAAENNSENVEFLDGSSSGGTKLTEFCDSFNHCTVISTRNSMMIHFESSSLINNKGFILNYTSIPPFRPSRNEEAADCIWKMDALNGTIASPNYPNFYENNQTCTFLLQAPQDKIISLYVEEIIMDGHDQCAFDYVEIYDGHADDGQFLAKFCGRMADFNNVVSSITNKMRVTFRSDNKTAFKGFIARYEVVTEAPKGSLCRYCKDDSPTISQKPIRMISLPENVTLAEGKSHLFSCLSDNPTIKPSWMKDLFPLTTGEQIQFPGLTILPNNSLHVTSMSWLLEGVYTCILTSQSNVQVFNAWLIYQPSDKDQQCDIKFNIVPQSSAILAEGTFQFLRCSTTNANITITWGKDGELITSNFNPRLQILLPGLLLINPLQTEDSGIYSCIATNENNCSALSETSLVVIQKPNSICGIPKITTNRGKPLGKISGGTKADRGTSPWQALLWERHLEGNTAFCSGALIHQDWVLTAAHCINQFKTTFGYELHLDDFFVKLGKYDAKIPEPQEQILKVQKIISHPKYDESSYDNDITLLHLEYSAEFSNYVQSLCIGEPEFLNRNVYNQPIHGVVTGWGKSSQQGPPQRYLRELYLPIVDDVTCKESVKEKGFLVTENMFCVGYARKGPEGLCRGDSGGPFAVELNHIWYLAGLVSWGDGCSASGGNYAFKTKVGNYYQWIYDTIKTNGKD